MAVIALGVAQARYGAIEAGHWADEAKWMTLVEIPAAIAAGWTNSATGKPTAHIYCNRDMAEALLRALENVVARGLLGELKTFDGCFMIRDVRAEPGKPSTHSYGLAIDLNAAENRLGAEPALSRALVACFTDEGFAWGGDFRRKDGMHFSRGWEA